MNDVLNIRDLTLKFRGYTGVTDVLHGVSLNIQAGEKVALVGESGSGKSVTARIVQGLLQDLKSAQIKGELFFLNCSFHSFENKVCCFIPANISKHHFTR